MTTFADRVYENGGAAVGNLLIPPGGKWYYVDGANGNDGNDGLTPATAVKTVSTAYGKTITGKNDVVAVIQSTSGISETAAITWSNNLTHLVGLAAPVPVGGRARIVVGAVDLAPFLTISGYGCIFANVQIQSLQADADSKIMVTISGDRNYFENVHFNGGGHATQAVDGGASVKLDGAQECKFKGCTFGCDTAVAGAGYANVIVDTESARDVFEDCIFQMYAGATSCVHVEVADNTGMDRWLIFKDCLFINDCRSYSLVEAFTVPGSMTSVTNYILLRDCWLVGTDDWNHTNTGVVMIGTGTTDGANTNGTFTVSSS